MIVVAVKAAQIDDGADVQRLQQGGVAVIRLFAAVQGRRDFVQAVVVARIAARSCAVTAGGGSSLL